MLECSLKLKISLDECVKKLQVQNRNILDEFSEKSDKTVLETALPLTSDEWEKVSTIHDILAPIKAATLQMSAEKYPTLPLMMPFFDDILDALETNMNNLRGLGQLNEDADSLGDGAEAAHAKMMKYFEVSSDLSVAATAMDPRFKMVYYENCIDSNYRSIAEQHIKAISDQLGLDRNEQVSHIVSTPSPSTVVRPRFLQQRMVQNTISPSTMTEYHHYLQEPLLQENASPLDWWKSNTYRYPKLSHVAKVLLAIPASSAASERTFAKARLAMPWNRCRLSTSSLQAIMCLRDWFNLDWLNDWEDLTNESDEDLEDKND
jgi:hypothetical protein